MNQTQDWEQVVLTKKKKSDTSPRPPTRKKEPSLDEEGKKLKTVPVHMAQAISRARTSLGLSRVQLAQKINEKPSVVSEVETGGCVYNHVQVNKILRALGLTLKNVSTNQSNK
jgi:ribosome-binding protein aMBF1 (putative translation factor)